MMINVATTQQQDTYSWRALYVSGSLDEADAQSGFASVDQASCTHVALLNHAGEVAHIVQLPGGATPVFFRRRYVSINLVEESSTPQSTVHCIGWKRNDEDAVYLFVFEDGSTLLSNALQAA